VQSDIFCRITYLLGRAGLRTRFDLRNYH
jgi:hypothetical protein